MGYFFYSIIICGHLFLIQFYSIYSWRWHFIISIYDDVRHLLLNCCCLKTYFHGNDTFITWLSPCPIIVGTIPSPVQASCKTEAVLSPAFLWQRPSHPLKCPLHTVLPNLYSSPKIPGVFLHLSKCVANSYWATLNSFCTTIWEHRGSYSSVTSPPVEMWF